MSRLTLALSLAGGVTVGAGTWAALKPRRRLRGRVRPYAQVVRSRLLRSVDPDTYLAVTRTPAGIRDIFTPVLESLVRTHSRLFGVTGPHLADRLVDAGLYPGLDPTARVAAHQRRSLGTGLAVATALGFVGWNTGGPIGLVLYGAGGVWLGSLITRGRVDNAIKRRTAAMRAELYTVNQILAMRARVGGGVADALRHIARHGTGIVAAEIGDILQLHRTGIPITDALRRAASRTAEPEAARLYHALAVAHERGVDLADTLLALAHDLRTARRDEAVTRAATRRIAAVVPIVMVLAPIALAFLAAPLPTLIFGNP